MNGTGSGGASLPAGEAGGRPIGIQVSALPSRFDEMLEVAVELELAARLGVGRGRRHVPGNRANEHA